jgi:hypothetical protein
MAYSDQVRRIMRRIEAIPAAVVEEVAPVAIKSGGELVGAMKQFAEASRDTGDLIESITMTPPGGTTPPYSQPGGSRVAGPAEIVVTVGNTDVRYPHLVEYGTADAEAQPYFWPAVNLLKTRIKRRVAAAMRKGIRRDWGK